MSETSLHVNLVMVTEMLKDATSPYVPSSGRDNEWLARRDRVIANAEREIEAFYRDHP